MDKGEIEVLLEGLDENNISSILNKWKEITSIKKKLDEFEEFLRNKAKIYLKDRNWKTYRDAYTDVSINLSTIKKTSIDKDQLRLILSDTQYAQVQKTIIIERLTIMTPEMRANMKKFLKK